MCPLNTVQEERNKLYGDRLGIAPNSDTPVKSCCQLKRTPDKDISLANGHVEPSDPEYDHIVTRLDHGRRLPLVLCKAASGNVLKPV